MADFCRFIEVAADGSDRELLARLRRELAQESDSFGICVQALSQMLGLKLDELILYDRTFVMKDDIVSIYLSGGLPDGVSDMIVELESQESNLHAVALQFGKLLKERVQHGLDDVVQGLDGAPAKDLYSRSIACLLRINMCALKVECDIRRRLGDVGASDIDFILDETGTSLCELLSQCCIILCIFGAEESNLFDDIKDIQETLLRLVPEPLILHIIGAFAAVAFDNSCLFSLHSRRIFVETLAAILPELIDRIALFNRMGMDGDMDLYVSRRSILDFAECGTTSLGSTWNTTHIKTPPRGMVSFDSVLQPVMDDLYDVSSLISIETPDWDYAVGNFPRVRTMSLLLDFILIFIRVASDGTVEKHVLGWLDALVSKPSFTQAFMPIFSSGTTTNFPKILELSRILGKDICVSHHILSVCDKTEEALNMIKVAGPNIIMSDTINRPKILQFMVEGVSKQPQPFIQCWCDLLKPLVVSTNDDTDTPDCVSAWSANMIMDGPISEVGDILLEAVIPHSLMRNFGDECHPDEDNVHACTARQLMVLLFEALGKKRVANKLNRFIDATHRLMQEPLTLESVQVFEFAMFSMWLLKTYELSVRNKKLHAYVKEVNERTLNDAIEMYDAGHVNDFTSVRLLALETIKKRIRASRLRNKVENHEDWYDDHQLKEANTLDWDRYYREFGDEMIKQMTEAVLECPLVKGVAPTVANGTTSGANVNRSRKACRKNVEGLQRISPDDGNRAAVSEFMARAKRLMHMHKLNNTESVSEDVYATIMAVVTHFNVKEDECTDIFKLMLHSCPLPLLHRVIGSGVTTLNVALMKAIMNDPHERYAGLVCAMMGMAINLNIISAANVGIIVSLMHLIAKAVWSPILFAELVSEDYELATLQNFVVFTNGLTLTSHAFLEARCSMNLGLLETYLQYDVPYATVPVTQFVQTQMLRLMEVRAAQFNIMFSGHPDIQPDSPAATGELNTLDLIIVSTLQLLFIPTTPPEPVSQRRREREDSDVLQWNLVGRECSIAFKTITLLLKCFCQLTMTKLMFIVEHFIGVAARINGDSHSKARQRILTDDSMFNPDAIEYLYQVYRNIAKGSGGVKPRQDPHCAVF
ncbi:hypothetical protein X943_000563 [Babesia divergens]|uniref:Uncharacterized protein n=1 Tax=Babesia divergens TaxID=32595 RepID=A0AAD9LJZ3_BABDI|nr:hypothetical protein X943_000563 [Babesia divergens]